MPLLRSLPDAGLPQVDPTDERSHLEPLWWRLADLAGAGPKPWMEADLAAFAFSGCLRLISLNRDFQPFSEAGLDRVLLQAEVGAGSGAIAPASSPARQRPGRGCCPPRFFAPPVGL